MKIDWDDTALHRMTTDLCEAAADRLCAVIRERSPGVRVERRGTDVVTDADGVKAEYGADPWAWAAMGDMGAGRD